MSDTRIFEIYRYDPDVDAAPRMQRYDLELTGERMLLDALISLKKQDETISYRRSCREGVCGSDAMNINGKNGLACLTNMLTLPKVITLLSNAAFDIQRVVIKQLLTNLQGSFGINEYAGFTIKTIFASFTTRFAGMINPSRCIAAVLSVNNATIFQRKVKSVVWVIRVVRVSLFSKLPTNPFAPVFNNRLALFDGLSYKNTLAMDW
jgi:hypothetical protein